METNSNPGRKRLLSYLGLGLILFAGAILIFIPDTPWPSLSPNAWLIFLILALIIIFVCLLLGCGLLMLGNLVLFKEIKGSLSLLALILMLRTSRKIG